MPLQTLSFHYCTNFNSAHAQIRVGDTSKASRDFQEAQVILKRYIDCKDCLNK